MKAKEQIWWTYVPHGLSAWALGLCVGGLLYFHDFVEPNVLALFFVCMLMLAVLCWGRYAGRHAVFYAATISLSILIGIAYAQYRTQELDARLLNFDRSGSTVRVQGIVLEEEFCSGAVWRTTLTDVLMDGVSIEGLVRVRTNQYFAQGTEIQLLAKLYAPSSAAIQGGFDFAQYAFFQELVAVGYSMYSADIIAKDTDKQQFWNTGRQLLYNVLYADFSTEVSAVLRALILGDRQSLTAQQSDTFRQSGLAHLLAISGLHIGMITFIVFGCIRRSAALFPRLVLYQPVHRYAAGIAVLFAYGYIELTGGAVSMYRAFMMICFIMLAWILERDAIRYRNLAIAAIVLFFARPFVVLEAGFLLSFSAVMVLIGYWQHREYWIDLFKDYPRILRNGLEIFISSMLISIATAPILWGLFQSIYPYGAVANVLAIPWMGIVVMPLILLYVLLSIVDIGIFIAPILEFSIRTLLWWSDIIAGWPSSAIDLPYISPPAMLMATGFVMILVIMPRLRWLSRGVLCICVFTVLALPLVLRQSPVFVLHRDTGDWAIITDNGLLFFNDNIPDEYYLAQWQQVLNRSVLSWQDTGRIAGLEWSCNQEECLILQHENALVISLSADCQADDQLDTVFPNALCENDFAYGQNLVRILLESDGIQAVSSKRKLHGYN